MRYPRVFLALTLIVLASVGAERVVYGSETDAVAISSNIQQRHLPYGTILDPIFTSPESDQIVGYTRAADSAIWTGHYLAAEAFRYRVTGSAEALDNVRRAIASLRALVDITGTDLLARCLIPVDSVYAPAIIAEESGHGIHQNVLNGREYYWIGNTSRDQYMGVKFGLGVAYEMVDDTEIRSEITSLFTRMLNFLLAKNWFVVMPDGSISTTFVANPDQRLSFLIVGRRVNSSQFASKYETERLLNLAIVGAAISYDLLDVHNSYFKFNLDTISLYDLLRLEGSFVFKSVYQQVYDVLRRTTDDHGNAHFNMIDRALKGADGRRDAETQDLLQQWLQRPRRDLYRDWRGDMRYPACGDDRACNPVAVVDRINTDFLWQRSPFLLYGGGAGTIETAGIDYILPYWMARYYGVVQD
ncbi:MAG: hypothetical protein J2P41_08520 [Blastocatellia bacterium]|nr:hypothetical protein [Blastocatellia bacterium]